jgi:hypothetical protein
MQSAGAWPLAGRVRTVTGRSGRVRRIMTTPMQDVPGRARTGQSPDCRAADTPFVLLFTVPLACASFHVLVQIPAGFLGAWLGRSRTTPVRYGSAVAVASALSLLLFWSLGWNSWGSILPAWADAMVRGSLGLVAYMWVMRAQPGSVRHG